MSSESKKFVENRNKTRKAFEAISFDSGNKKKSLLELCQKTNERFEVEINWYDVHADRRRWWSAVIRGITILFAVSSGVILTLRSLNVGPEYYIGDDFLRVLVSYEAALVAAIVLVLAGGVLLADGVFQVTSRYGKWRIIEYSIRVMRSDFEVLFYKKFGGLGETETTVKDFNDARVLCLEQFKKAEELIKEETENWQKNMAEAMASLQKKIDNDAKEMKKIVVDTEKKHQELVSNIENTAAILKVFINDREAEAKSLSLEVRNYEEKVVKELSGLSPKDNVSFLLKSGTYKLVLLDQAETTLGSLPIRLEASSDEERKI